MPENILLVSDVHSRDDALPRLIDNLTDQLNSGAHLVFLGDLNDCRDKSYQEKCSFEKIYNLVRQLCDEGYATLVHSNHSENLCDHYLERRKVRKNIMGFKHTLAELDELEEEYRKDIIEWLDSRPLGVSYTLDNGKHYHIAHAFHDRKLNYADPSSLSPEDINRTLRGIKHSWLYQGKKYSKYIGFWRNPQKRGAVDNHVLCAGHWEQVIVTDNCVVNDPGGHQTDGTIGVYNALQNDITIYENK